jgi:adenosylmethionine-8-amino-7-oxononanoate aminotransferase
MKGPDMKDENFLKANNARSLWHPMTAPSDSLKNAPTIVTGATGRAHPRCRRPRGGGCRGGAVERQPRLFLPAGQGRHRRPAGPLPYYSIFRGTSNDKVIELAEELRAFFAPDGLTRAFYTSRRLDSVETALRLARQYHKIKGEAGRVKFLSLKKGYHGTHMGGASVNGNANFRTPMSRSCPAATTSPPPTPTATPSTRPTRPNWRNCACRRWRTRSPSRAPAPSPPSSWSRSWAPAA